MSAPETRRLGLCTVLLQGVVSCARDLSHHVATGALQSTDQAAEREALLPFLDFTQRLSSHPTHTWDISNAHRGLWVVLHFHMRSTDQTKGNTNPAAKTGRRNACWDQNRTRRRLAKRAAWLSTPSTARATNRRTEQSLAIKSLTKAC